MDLGQVGVSAAFGQWLAPQPGPVLGKDGAGVGLFATSLRRLLASSGHTLPPLVEASAGLCGPASDHVSGSSGPICFH